jgi:hypothetical protein
VLQRHFKEVLWVCSIVCTVAAGCGKDRKTLNEGDAQGATGEPIVVGGQALDPITPDNHVPPATYLVQSYDIETLSITPPLEDASSGSSGATGLLPPHDAFRLADDSATERFYVSHPITVTTGIKVEGGSASMMVTFGLMEEPAANSSIADRAQLHACTLGSIEIRHSGDPEEPTQTFTGQFRIPSICLKPGTDSGRYHIWVASDVEGAVKTVGSEKSKPKIVVYDEAYINANNICLQTRKEGPCITAIQVERSPGINASLKEMATSSSVATFDPNYVEGEGSDIALLTMNSEALLEGLAEDDPTVADYQLLVNYEICATRTANTKGDDPSCSRDSTSWLPLQIEDPESPEGTRQMVDQQTVKKLRTNAPLNFSSTLYARGETFTKLKAADGWGKERTFLIRQCIKPYKNGSLVEQKNITAQAANPDPTLDDCRMAAVIMADVRATPAPASKAVCVDASGNPGEQSFTLAADCVPVSKINDPTAYTLNDTLASDTTNVKMLDLGFEQDRSWGKRGLVQLVFPTYLTASAGAEGATYEGYKRASLQGIWGKPIDIVEQAITGSVPYEKDGFHYSVVSMLGVELFSRYKGIGESYEWTWTPVMVTPPKKKKGVKKAKKYDRATQKITDASGSKDGPAAIAVREKCKEVTAQVNIVRVGIEACAEGGIYLDAGIRMRKTTSLTAEEQTEMPGVSKLGSVDGWFMPALAANVRGTVYLDAVIFRAGVEGTLTLIQVGYPIIGNLKWGTLANNTRLQVKAYTGVDWDLSWLDGNIDVFADIRSIAWCSAWFFDYPCGFTWARLATYTFVDFRGGNVRAKLHRKELKNTIIEL